jgi:DNA-binding NtrC family response regulator
VTADAPRIPVLVADDEEQLLRLCIRVLGKQGYAVLTARDGDEAVRIFSGHSQGIRAMVIDATLPPKGAASVLAEISPLPDDVGVIFTSGDELSAPMREALLAKQGVFLRKPFAAAALARAVQDSLKSEGS